VERQFGKERYGVQNGQKYVGGQGGLRWGSLQRSSNPIDRLMGKKEGTGKGGEGTTEMVEGKKRGGKSRKG